MTKSRKRKKEQARFVWKSSVEHVIITLAHAVTCEQYYAINIIKPAPEKPTIYHLVILNIIFGLPIVYMQLIIGKFARTGCLFFSRFMPIACGLGYSMFTVCLFQSFGYAIMLANILYYFVMTFAAHLPWMTCLPEWSPHCIEDTTTICNSRSEISAQNYYKYVLEKLEYDKATGTDVSKYALWPFGIAMLLVVFIITYLYTLQGIKGIKIVLKFYAITSFICTIILLCLITLVGSKESYTRIFYVDTAAMTDVDAWFRSVQIVVSSLAIDNGVHFLYGSYVKKEVNLNKMATIINGMIFMCCVLFAIITHGAVDMISKKTGCDFAHLSVSDLLGRELLFIIVPNALGLLGIPQTWCVIYFISLVLIGINAVVTRIDYLYCALSDQFPLAKMYGSYILGFTCLLGIVSDVPFMSTEGYVMMQYVFFEAVRNTSYITLTLLTMSVFWLYSVDRLSIDVHFMDGNPPAMYWKILWIFSTFIGVIGLILEIGFHIGISKAPLKSKAFEHISQIQLLTEIIIVLPIVLGVIFSISKQLKRHNLPALFLPGDNWGPPDPKMRADRKLFNPRMETRYFRLVDDCKHHCLCRSKIMDQLIQYEEKVRAAELLILNQLMQQSELDDEEEERQYEAIRDEVYADSNKF